MFKKLLTTRSLCLSAIIAALYAALTLLLAPISYGNIQCRVSEAFTVLPMVLPQSIPGLFVGCLIANIFSPTPSIWDIVFGFADDADCGVRHLRAAQEAHPGGGLPDCGKRRDCRSDAGAAVRSARCADDGRSCHRRAGRRFPRHGAADGLEVARGL